MTTPTQATKEAQVRVEPQTVEPTTPLPSTHKTQAVTTNHQRHLEQTKTALETSRHLLHTSVTEVRYKQVSSGCCEAICKVYKFILFALFGKRGYFLGAAKDERVGVKAENRAIERYETALKALVDFTKSNQPDQSAELDELMNNFYTSLISRMMQISMMNPTQSVTNCFDAAMQDIDSAIAKHNEENPTNKINTKWVEQIKGELGLRSRDTTKTEKIFVQRCAKVIPGYVQKHGLKSLADFAISYINLFGYSQTAKKPQIAGLIKAALRLRESVYFHLKKDETSKPEIVYFAFGKLDEQDSLKFIHAALENTQLPNQAGDHPVSQWYISA